MQNHALLNVNDRKPPSAKLISKFLCGLSAVILTFSALAAEKHGMGFIPENPDAYAAMPQVSRYRAYFSPETDLSPLFPKPGNQGKQGSCVAWATAYAARSYMEAKRLGENPRKPEQIFSPAFIFNQVKVGNCKDGGSIAEALSLMKTRGVASLAEFPYDEQNCSRLPDAEVISDAKRFRIDDWKRVDINQLDDMKGQIYAGHPVIFGMFVSDGLEKLGRNQIYDEVDEPRVGGHAMVAVGYSEAKQAFKIVNSWGDDWADNGFGWISYRAMQKWTQNAFIMQLAKNVSPKPEPMPAVYEPSVTPEPEPLPEPIPTPQPYIPPPRPKPHPVVSPQPVVKPMPVVSPLPPAPEYDTDKQAEIRQALAKLLAKAACADLHGAMSANQQVRLTGFAGERAEMEHIKKALEHLGATVSLDAAIRPWPQCEALLTFRDELAKPEGLQLSLNGKNPSGLTGGDPLSIELETPNFPSYLYLSYIQANGDAVQLLAPQGRFPKALAPNTRLRLGDGVDGGAKFTITPPYGAEMLVAVAAASPLFDGELPSTQTERDYLTKFRQAFLTKPQPGAQSRQVSAAMLNLQTRPIP